VMVIHKEMLVRCCCFSLAMAGALAAQQYIDPNVGLMISKSALGVSLGSGSNEINIGLKSSPLDLFATRDFIVQPGITYNRLLHSSGFYGSVTYAPVYVKMDQRGSMTSVGLATRTPIIGPYHFMTDGWNAGELFFGIGKGTQLKNWGINVDGNIITPAVSGFMHSWFYQLGLGVSYRFQTGR
jgi:hypothetical protein